MVLDGKPASPISLFEQTDPDYVIANGKEKILHPVTFEYVSQNRISIASAALIWATNAYFVDVEAQTFVVNGGKKIRFEEWLVEDPILLLVRRHLREYKMNDGSQPPVETMSFFLGYEGISNGEKKMMAMFISPSGNEFRFVTRR